MRRPPLRKGGIQLNKRVLALASAVLLCAILCFSACGKKPTDGKTSSQTPDTGTSTSATDDDGIFDPGDNPFGDDTTISDENPNDTTAGQNGETSPTTSGNKINRPSSSSSSSTPKTTLAPPTSELEAAAARMPKVNLTNKTVTILSHAKHEAPEVLGVAYKGYTLKSEQVSTDAVMTRFVTMVNSGKSPDLLWSDYNPQLIAKQYVQAWDSHIDLNNDIWKGVKPSIDNWKVGGKHYYIFATGGRQNIFLYNRAMFKAKGLTEPAELFKQGKWDWDALENMVKKLTIDENNDGKPEQYGLALDGGAHAFVFSTGTDYVKFTNARPKNMLLSAEVTRAMEFYIKLNKDNKLFTGGNMTEAFERGEIAILNTQKWVALKNKDKIASGEYMYTTTPKDPKASAHYTAEETPGYYLPKGAKNIPGAVAYMIASRFGYVDEGLKKANAAAAAAKGEATPKVITDMETLIDQKTTAVQLGWTYLQLGPYLSDINLRPLTGESWSKVAAEVSPKIDNAIKTFNTNTSIG